MVKKAEGTDRAFFWGTDFSTQGYMKWTLESFIFEIRRYLGQRNINFFHSTRMPFG